MSHIHIPDGVLPTWLWVLGWALALLVVTTAGRIAERADIRRRVPLVAVVSALMIVAMSSEIVPLAYHVNLTVIGGVLLGPVLAIIAAFIVEIILAMLGHGGVTVLGLNTIVIAIEMVLGQALFAAFIRLFGKRKVAVAAFIATVLTLACTTSLVVGIVALSGPAGASRETGALDPGTLKFANPFAEDVFRLGLFSGGEGHGSGSPKPAPGAGKPALSVGRFAAVVYTLGPIGWALEGLLTAWVLGYVSRVRPELLWPKGRRRSRRQGDDAREASADAEAEPAGGDRS